ncbi:MAG TPA: substrate-binding domain-containing protein [Actinomycetes bacterium]|nr:substrate-binding domain-containing protein [Actinomycetes bacterium]
MTRWWVAAAALVALACGLAACGGGSPAGRGAAAGSGPARGSEVILATTTSTQDSGLLDVLVPAFQAETGHRVKTIAVGSGQAIELGRRGEADVVLAHSPAAEQQLVASGVTGGRLLVMHNDFVVIGPANDPAGVAKTRGVVGAMRAIASGAAPFISRGDQSGTHTLELKLWQRAGITPGGRWYQESGQGMGATIQIAAEQRAYTIADRGTYLATRTQAGSGLKVVFEGDPALRNVYHVIPITRAAGQRVNQDGGLAFANWLAGKRAQGMIAEFGVATHGRPLFVPDAGKREADLAAAA